MWPEVTGRSTFAIGQAYQMVREAANQLYVHAILTHPTLPCRSSPLKDDDVCPYPWIDP